MITGPMLLVPDLKPAFFLFAESKLQYLVHFYIYIHERTQITAYGTLYFMGVQPWGSEDRKLMQPVLG